ncbi:ABC transporter substrate-binding protein [Wansuia hejianensis]|uniref:Spermidine/putrescine ABC transporter substrate-binding protein n=1 Tax=Wansuia hejianensis TaxID=2763667 RepID=A0A926EYJ7_9FIRM|nr:spermidine/putrescine ABC transporter substrate-binding protein [Wansuia hejianensis]MBC8590855.1 spermidine/putrescine ABC transporter substrate-binding protein [Wansuia hejianensis]
MKKQRISILLVLLIILTTVVTGCGEKKPSINVYNWGDYIDREILEDFEKEYGIKVKYDTFATNEDLYVKIKQGGSSFDVIFPSDYMIERMIREDLLTKIDKANIPNLTKVEDRFLNLAYDPNNEYSVPYMWGTVGILYNKSMISEKIDGWEDLWNEKYKGQIFMLDSQRDTLAVALKKLGYSMNTRNTDELEAAKVELIKQKPLVDAYLGDEIKDAMVSGDGAIAVVWSGDAVEMMRQNSDLEYVIPKEGTNLWFDAMVIPKSAKNKEGAEAFINFLSRPDIAAKNAEYIGYSIPIPEGVNMLSNELKDNPVAYPTDEEMGDVEIFKDPMDIIQVYDRIWTEIKSEE